MRARQVPTGLASAPASESGRILQVLFRILAADFQSTEDQALTKIHGGTEFVITNVQAIRRSGGVTVACSGGIYTAAAKGGTALVGAGQNWLNVTGTLGVERAVIAVPGSSSSTLFLSLSTGSTAAVTADVYVSGIVLS